MPGPSLQVVTDSWKFAQFSLAAYNPEPLAGQWRGFLNEDRPNNRDTDTQVLMGRLVDNDVKREELIIAFRGTAGLRDWLTNGKLEPTDQGAGTGEIHGGFSRAVTSVYQDVKRFITNHRTDNSRIILCGHSLGGALAKLTAFRLKTDNARFHPHAVFTYGAPRVGNENFAKAYKTFGLKEITTAWYSKGDPVPRVPRYVNDYRHVTDHHWELQNHEAREIQLDSQPEYSQHEQLDVKKILPVALNLMGPDNPHSMQFAYCSQLLVLRNRLQEQL